MELWVRSQDKTKLIKTDDLSLEKFDDQNYQIKVNDNYYVGCYRTEQRALEVLDEIQEHIKWLATLSYREREISSYRPEVIYQMPEE